MAVFQLAENLHMTVAQLLRDMPLGEYMGWLRFYEQRNNQTSKNGQPNLLSNDGAGLVKGLGL